jgi:serine/threonine-protein kinase RsbT
MSRESSKSQIELHLQRVERLYTKPPEESLDFRQPNSVFIFSFAPPLVLSVQTAQDAVVAAMTTARFAKEAGFGRCDAAEIGTAASELATNIVRHAHGRGRLTLSCTDEYLEILSEDEGPSTEQTVQWLRECPSEDPAHRRGRGASGGLGHGISAVQRLMDDFAVQLRPEGGLWVRARRSRARSRGAR